VNINPCGRSPQNLLAQTSAFSGFFGRSFGRMASRRAIARYLSGRGRRTAFFAA